MTPDQPLYAKTHEWVHVEQEGDARIATIGLSAFAVELLTDLVFVELPEVGRTVSAGESFAEVESVKAVSDLYSPVGGEVVEVNAPLVDALETLSSDPLGAGWLVKIKISGQTALMQRVILPVITSR